MLNYLQIPRISQADGYVNFNCCSNFFNDHRSPWKLAAVRPEDNHCLWDAETKEQPTLQSDGSQSLCPTPGSAPCLGRAWRTAGMNDWQGQRGRETTVLPAHIAAGSSNYTVLRLSSPRANTPLPGVQSCPVDPSGMIQKVTVTETYKLLLLLPLTCFPKFNYVPCDDDKAYYQMIYIMIIPMIDKLVRNMCSGF